MRSSFKSRISNFDLPISSFLSKFGKPLILFVAGAVWLALPAPLAAQGCAMCYTSAAAAKEAGLQALRNGILVLGIPPLVMFIGIFLYVLRRRDRFNDAGFEDDRGRDDMPSAPPPPLPRELGEESEEAPVVAGWSGDHDRSEHSISSGHGR